MSHFSKCLSAQNFSNSVDLDWHFSPEGQSVFAHLKDPVLGTRRIFGEIYHLEFVLCP